MKHISILYNIINMYISYGFDISYVLEYLRLFSNISTTTSSSSSSSSNSSSSSSSSSSGRPGSSSSTELMLNTAFWPEQ